MSHSRPTIDKAAELADARNNIARAREAIERETRSVEDATRRRNGGAEDEVVREKLLRHFAERREQLDQMRPSPYFARCDVRGNDGDAQTWLFGKFPLAEAGIFSWMSPAARLRFADIGPAAYARPAGGAWNGTLARKDQFLVVDGKIVFFSSEAEGYGRTLVYQEELSRQKPGFMLAEIVERMERAQDDVIRAPAEGSFLIAGPAGSGKTTLAFHRIAYLTQSPDTAARFPSRSVIAFVQDEGTRAYFSRLLPDLGIHDVEVTTFGTWAIERLELAGGASFVRRPNGVDEKNDAYDRRKRDALRSGARPDGRGAPFARLARAYAPFFGPEDTHRFAEQSARRELDRFDLTMLLLAAKARGPLTRQEEFLVRGKNFSVTRTRRAMALSYALVVVDEAQNYLPEQIDCLRSCVSPETNAMLYVGDLGQQVLVGTLRDWSDAGESFDNGRAIRLEKVYRNTKAILRYAAGLGFAVEIPDGLREGEPVAEAACDPDEALARVRAVADAAAPGTHVGILGLSADTLRPFATAFAGRENVHVMSVHEAQGVEFNAVCLVGIPRDFVSGDEERCRIRRDLLYVALTRAMDRLWVFWERM